MRMIQDTPLCLAAEGRHTLQVPQYYLGDTTKETFVDYPDEFFIFVKYDGSKLRCCAGREQGFTYMSRLGFKHFYNDLQKVFRPNRGTWQEFVDEANRELDEIQLKTTTELAKLKAVYGVEPTPYLKTKIDELTDYLKRL